MVAEFVLVTSLRVGSTQKRRAFDEWSRIGVATLSVNNAVEAAGLADEGVTQEQILPVEGNDVSDNGQPWASAVLDQARRQHPDRAVVLAAPCTFPAMRSSFPLAVWSAAANVTALTPERCAVVETARLTDCRPVRSHLAACVIMPRVVDPLVAALKTDSEAAVVGAAPSLTLAALAQPFGLAATDSGLLLCEAAGTAGLAPADPPVTGGALTAFQAVFVAECDATRSRSATLKAAAFRPAPAALTREAHAVTANLIALAPWVSWAYDRTALAALAARERRDPATDPRRLQAFFCTTV